MKWILVVVMFFHGLIHLMGGVNELGLAKVEGLSGKTLLLLPDNLRPVLGVIWFVAVIIFLVACLGLISNHEWWRTVAVVAVIISQLLIVIWWPDAKWGTIANVLIIIGAAIIPRT